MPVDASHGPVSKSVDTSKHNLTGLHVNASPMPDLKNDPSNDVMRAIRGMKFGSINSASWKPASDKGFHKNVK